MKVAVIARLFAERNMDVDAAHFLVFSRSHSLQFAVLRLKTETENYFFTLFSLFFTKASQPE